MESGRKVVAAAGTAEQLSTAAGQIIEVAIQAETDNTGRIAVGDSGVVAAEGATCEGVVLSPGGMVTLPINQLSKVYLDSSVSGDGVTYVAVKP